MAHTQRSSPAACRRLACAVILDAVEKVRGERVSKEGKVRKRYVSKADREQALYFLNGPGLDFWATAAGLDPERVRRKVRETQAGVRV